LQTGVILDHNSNPVPDGTPVQFIQQDRIQGFINVIAERPTINGIANLDYLLEARAGNFRITATSGEASTSQEVDIVIGENAVVSVSTPTPAPTATPSPSSTPTPSPTPTATPTNTPTPTPSPTTTPEPVEIAEETPEEASLTETPILIAFGLGLVVTGGAGYYVGRNGQQNLSNIVRCILWGLVGSLLAYNYFVLGLPGTDWLETLGSWAGLLTTLAGGAAGIGLYQWQARQRN
jgi:hypothetical protein